MIEDEEDEEDEGPTCAEWMRHRIASCWRRLRDWWRRGQLWQ